MSNDPTSRAELRRRLAATIGEEAADSLMEALPPHRWDELATKQDLTLLKSDLERLRTDFERVFAHHREVIDARFDANEHKLVAAFHQELSRNTRAIVFSQIGVVLSTATAVIAAAKLL